MPKSTRKLSRNTNCRQEHDIIFADTPLARSGAPRQRGKDLGFQNLKNFKQVVIMLLRNFDHATKYFDYKSKTELEDSSTSPIKGWYKFINGLFSALLVVDNSLCMLYGANKYLITDSCRVLIEEKNKLNNEFVLIEGDNELIRFSYSLPDPKLNAPPFEYLDEEDFSWERFVEKIINDKERQRNFVINLMENR